MVGFTVHITDIRDGIQRKLGRDLRRDLAEPHARWKWSCRDAEHYNVYSYF